MHSQKENTSQWEDKWFWNQWNKRPISWSSTATICNLCQIMANTTEHHREACKCSDYKEPAIKLTDLATTRTMSLMVVIVEKVHINSQKYEVIKKKCRDDRSSSQRQRLYSILLLGGYKKTNTFYLLWLSDLSCL